MIFQVLITSNPLLDVVFLLFDTVLRELRLARTIERNRMYHTTMVHDYDIENKRQHRMHRKMITETQNNNSLHNEGIGFKQILVQVWGLGIYRRECRIDQRFCWS